MPSYSCENCGVTIETDDPNEIAKLDRWGFVCGYECSVQAQESVKEEVEQDAQQTEY